MENKPEVWYRRERWEGQNESVVVGPGWEKVPGTHTDREADKMALIANIAYAEGHEAGRASRDGLREELKRLQSVVGEVDYDLIEEALAEDEKNG